MKVGNLMKSLESDESRQPDEKFGKWWNSTTWWKVGKVMKSGKTLEKCNLLHGLSFRHFFVQENFAQKLFFEFEVTYFEKQKQQKNCLEKREWKWFEEATRLRGNFEPNNCTRPPISTSNIAQYHFAFYFWMLLSRPQVWIKPQMQTLQEVGELLWNVPIFTSIDVQKRSRKISLYK